MALYFFWLSDIGEEHYKFVDIEDIVVVDLIIIGYFEELGLWYYLGWGM